MRFLFVCTGNVARSPAAEAVLRDLSGRIHETRSAGISPFCPRPLTVADLAWTEVVAVMEADHLDFIATRWPAQAPKVQVLDVGDHYHRDDPALLSLLEERLGALLARCRVV